MNARVKFTPKPEKIVDSILYLALKDMELDQYKAVKLLYLADRQHLRRFGRPITFDRYVAMKFGPVASFAFDILRGKERMGVNPSNLPFDLRTLGNITLVQNPKRDIDRLIFSRSDLMVLDQVAEEYGDKGFGELYEITHSHFAYDRAWNNRSSKADEMRFEDFLVEDASKEDRISDLAFTSNGMWSIASVGDIFKFRSEKVIGHDSRDKYHVAINLSKGAMLFISSNPFEGAMRIDQSDWPEMPKAESYISCSSLLRYNKHDVEGITPVAAGRLSDDCLTRLEAHVAASYVLEIREIDIILSALTDYAA